METKEIENKIKKCSENFQNAKNETAEMELEEVIELVAYIKKKIVSCDKWDKLISFITLILGIKSIDTVTDMISSDAVKGQNGGVFVLFLIAILIFYFDCWSQSQKGICVKVLSYLEEIEKQTETRMESKKERICSGINEEKGRKITSYQELMKRQMDERRELLEEWRNMQKYTKEQIDLLENCLDRSNI